MIDALELGFWRTSRVRLIRQTEITECGLACISMVANYHGLRIDLGTLRQQFPPSLRGVTLHSLIQLADRMGLTPRAVKLPLEQIPALVMPAILHWNLDHFVVAARASGKRVLIYDPEGSARWYRLEELSKHFTGIALELTPAASFERVDKRNYLSLTQLWNSISGLKRACAQLFILTLVLQAFVLISPYYMQVALDSAVPAVDRNLLIVLALGFGMIAIADAGAALLRSFVLLAAGTTFGFGIASNIGRRLLRLPVDWFERRHVGAVLARFQSILPIQTLLTEGAAVATVDGSLTILTVLVMFFYSPGLTYIALSSLGLYIAVRVAMFDSQRDALSATITARGIEQTHMIESFRGINSLRLSNRETLRHVAWQAKLADSINAATHVTRLNLWHTHLNKLLFGLESVASIYLAARSIMDGGFTTGMAFAYMAYKQQLLKNAQSFIDQLVAFGMVRLHLEQLSDIASTREDISFRSSATMPLQFDGSIELRDVTFRYSSTDPLILRGASLKLNPGDHVAITGASGCGKSTLAKIILGLVEPNGGEVLVGGRPLAQFGHKAYHDQIAGVLQDDVLFLGAISENIALFDDAPDMNRIMAAAAAAAIHDEIVSMPMGYHTIVGFMGSALSGGQKQRILLARALYRRPRLLVVDEGTAHLDVDNERKVNAAVAQMRITRLIIAHRHETVACAHRVFEMRDGLLKERSRPSPT